MKFVEVNVNENEYKNPKALYSVLYNAVKRGGFPIDVNTSNGKVYLTRRDL